MSILYSALPYACKALYHEGAQANWEEALCFRQEAENHAMYRHARYALQLISALLPHSTYNLSQSLTICLISPGPAACCGTLAWP